MKKCRRCLLPQSVPGAHLNAAGICPMCREYARADGNVQEEVRKSRETDLEKALEACRGQGDYDCIVNLSGGKDSCYLLYRAKREYGLKVLAFTTNMNLPDVAVENINRTVGQLGVDHILYTPPREFYRKLYRFLLQNQEQRGAVRTVCYVCAPLYEGYSLRLAVAKKIPLVLAAYSPGQPEPERMEYEFPREVICQTDWTPPEVRESGLFDEDELARFWNPLRYPPGTRFPRYLAPFHAWPYSQTVAMKKVVELGLIDSAKKASPVYSNCPLNWLLMYSDLKNLGYNPYAPEFSKLIREGKASRRYWRIVGPIVNAMIRTRTFHGRNVSRSLTWLGLRPEELRMTRAGRSTQPAGLPVPTLDG